MNWRVTVATGLIFVALLAFVWVETRQRVAEEGEVFRHSLFGLNLYGIDTDKITRLRIERQGEEPLELEKRGERWFITEPIRSMANSDEVTRMIREIAELRPTTTREGVDLSGEEFGLVEPDLVATITYNGNRTASLALGAETPAGAERYARVSADSNLHVVPGMLRTTLWNDPASLREKSLVKIESDDVRRIILEHGGERIVAVRSTATEGPAWTLTSPISTGADEWNLRQVISGINEMSALEFLSVDEAPDAGFDTPQATATLEMMDGESIEIAFGATSTRAVGEPAEEKEIVHVRTSEREEILLVSAEAVGKVRQTTFDLRDKSVVSFDRNRVTRIRVERAEGFSFTVGSRPDGWQVERPRSMPARRGTVDDILWNLEDLSAIEFVTEETDARTLREYGLAVPQTAITIELRGRAQPIKVLIGKESPHGDYYAMTSENDQVVRVSQFLMTDLPESIEDLEHGEHDLPDIDSSFFDMD